MFIFAVSGFVNAFAFGLFALFLLFRFPQNRLAVAFGIFNLCGLVWGFFYGMWQLAPNAELALLYSRGLMLGAIPLSYTFFRLTLLLLDVYEQHRILVYAFFAITVFFWVADLTPYFVASVEPRSIFPFWPTPGILFHPFLVIWFSAFFYAWYLLSAAISKTTGMKRNQLIYVFILTLSVILFGGVNNYLLWYNIPVIPFGSFIIPFFPVAMTYLILKYQIMDIKMALRKSLVYSAVIVVITVLYMSIIFISSSVLQKLAGNNLWLNLLLVLLLALFLQPIKDFVQDKVDRLFDKKKLDYQEALAVAAKISRSFSNINSSLKVILHNIIDKMGLEKAEFYIINSKGDAYCNVDGTSTCELSRAIIECLKETKTYLVKEELVSHFVEFSRKSRTKIDRSAILADFNALQCSLVVPCFNEDKLDGFFSLGEKRSQDQFTKEDTRFMESIAGYVAMAIENEILLEKERATAEKIAQEKVASIVQTAVTFNHEINNPLTVIMSNAEILSKLIDQGSKLSTEFIQERMKLINQDSMKIKKIMEKMEKLTRPVVKEYLPGTAMLDVNALPDEPPPAK